MLLNISASSAPEARGADIEGGDADAEAAAQHQRGDHLHLQSDHDLRRFARKA